MWRLLWSTLVSSGQKASGSDAVTAAEEYVKTGKDVDFLHCGSSASVKTVGYLIYGSTAPVLEVAAENFESGAGKYWSNTVSAAD
jgi:hypothetical protein